MELAHTWDLVAIFLDRHVPDLHNGNIESRDTDDGSRDLFFSPPSFSAKALTPFPLP